MKSSKDALKERNRMLFKQIQELSLDNASKMLSSAQTKITNDSLIKSNSQQSPSNSISRNATNHLSFKS